MSRPTDDQYLEVCKHCIAYLSEKHPNEKGLFRSSVSQTEVRALQTQILQFSNNTFRDEPDPHLVAEVIQTTFKNLTFPLLHEVYQDIVETDLDDEDFDISELAIQKWIVKLPESKFYLAVSLFQLLARLAALDESDTNLIQLAYCVSPTICRPTTSAYMSIRHMEDLRKVRPVISFIIENCDEVFVDGLQPLPFPYNGSGGDNSLSPSIMGGRHLTNQVSLGFGSFVDGIVSDPERGDGGDISTMMSTAMVIDTSSSSSGGSKSGSEGKGGDNASVSSMDDGSSVGSNEDKDGAVQPPSKRPHLIVSVPSTSVGADGPPVSSPTNAAASAAAASAPTTTTASVEVDPLQHYSDTEWNVLEALITSKSALFLDFDDKSQETYMSSRSDSFDRRSGSMDESSPATPNSTNSNSKRNSGNYASPTPPSSSGGADGSGSSAMLASPPTAPHPSSAAAGGSISAPSSTSPHSAGGQSKTVFKNRRRRMVADCKALRSQIFEFEQEWTRKHNRVPKNFERGSMESVYTRYRKLKKEIRDLAATDIERCGRGFLARVRLGIVTKEMLERVKIMKRSSSSGSGKQSSGDQKTTTTAAAASSTAPTTATASTVPAAGAGAAAASSGSGESLSADSIAAGTSATDQYAQYRALLVQKRDLKRELKRFDEEFLEKWGRAPKKSDKEVIRPMYQNYHEIKNKLEHLRTTIEASHGPLPDDLQDTDGRASLSSAGSHSSLGVDATLRKENRAGSIEDLAGDSEDMRMSVSGGLPSSAIAAAVAASGDGAEGTAAAADGSAAMQSEPGADGVGSLAFGAATSKVINVEGELEALQMEKRNLHAYLKVYERDFSRLHGRPVTKHADIQPVAHEYQRYKELKSLIREKKMKLGVK